MPTNPSFFSRFLLGLSRVIPALFLPDALRLPYAQAALDGNLDDLRAACPFFGVDRNVGLKDKRTALLLATLARRADCVVFLLSKGADARKVGPDGRTALVIAAANGDLDCLRLLLPVSDPMELSLGGYSALIHAVVAGSAPCVAALLPALQKAAPQQFAASKRRALLMAMHVKVPECAALLADREACRELGLSPRPESSADETALMTAAGNGSIDWIRLLLPFSDTLQTNSRGDTALMLAAAGGHSVCVAELLPKSDPAQLNVDLKNALDLAFSRNSAPCVDLLVGDNAIAADKAVRQFGAQRTPRAHALVEATALRAIIDASPSSRSSAKVADAQPDASSRSAPSSRRTARAL